MLHISGKLAVLNSRLCEKDEWEGTLKIDFFDLVKQLEEQGHLCNFKLHGISYDPSKTGQII
jgi:hypothetical protein